MKATLKDIKNSAVPSVVNLGPCDPAFTQLVNDAQYRLSEEGKWWGTYARMRMCVPKGCITWPREVKTVEGFNLCGWSIPIRNGWFEFQTYVRAPQPNQCRDDCWTPNLLERSLPPSCQYRDFDTDSKIRLYPNAADVGKRVLVQGKDPNGVEIRTVDTDTGAVVYGEYVELATPFVETTNTFKAPLLSGVQKPLTSYNVIATAYSVDTSIETEIAIWEPSETNPSYRRNFLFGRPRGCSTNYAWNCKDHGDGCRPADTVCADLSCEVLYRREFIPALQDSDWLLISKIPALEREMVAIQQERRNEWQEAEINHQRAVKLLRQELEAYSPQQRVVITALPEGDAFFRRVQPWGQW